MANSANGESFKATKKNFETKKKNNELSEHKFQNEPSCTTIILSFRSPIWYL